MKPSAIGWTDYSGGDLNFVTGCTPVSEGCANCYARAIYERFGRDFSKITMYPDKLARLERYNFDPIRKKGNHRGMCFVCDTGDLFHKDIPTEFIIDAFEVMRFRRDVIWQILTKRAWRIPKIAPRYGDANNILIGISAENQRCLDERLPYLAKWPGVRFVSIEPMLEPVTLADHYVDWVICGAESGPHRRSFEAAWAEALYDECQKARIPFFGKQDSGLRPGAPLLIHGKEVKQWPV